MISVSGKTMTMGEGSILKVYIKQIFIIPIHPPPTPMQINSESTVYYIGIKISISSKSLTIFVKIMPMYKSSHIDELTAVARTLIGGGCLFIYSCSARQVSFEIKFKFINLKRN